MKAKVRETGKVIDVTLNLCSQPVESSGATSVYEGSDGNTYFDTELDFVNVYIDWEQRRYEIAKAVLQGLNANGRIILSNEEKVEKAVLQADLLIDRLRNYKKSK